MYFKDAFAQLTQEVNKTNADDETKTKFKFALNSAKLTVAKAYHWKELKRQDELVLIPNYTTGTVSITQDSRTVTGSGTAWTSSMAGRFFQHSATGYWYRIASVASATSLMLVSPIIESTTVGLTYQIYKRYYRVNTDIRIILPDEGEPTLPLPFTIEGYDLTIADYTTGSVAVTANSNILTGTGTIFLGNVFPGDSINVEANRYIIKSVDSDTQITMVNKALTGFDTSATSYSISSEAPIQAESKAPSLKTIIQFFYIRHLYPMVNDNDSTELSNKFDRVILDWAKTEYDHMVNSPNYGQDLAVAQARLETLKADSSLVWFPYRQLRPLIPAGNGRGAMNAPHLR